MMMKRLIIVTLLIMILAPGFGQILRPVSWEFTYEATGKNEYELILTAIVDENWHIYSVDLPVGGPIPTTAQFIDSDDYRLTGTLFEEGEPIEYYDEGFRMDVIYFADRVEFRQKIESSKRSFVVKGTVSYMACDDSRCTPPLDDDFEISVTTTPSEGAAGGESSSGLIGFLLVSLLAGFAGVLTPCVFPMIPMTVAFFSRSAGNRSKSIISAAVFGISIILIYSSLGILVSLTSAGAGIANALSTHWLPNVLFFSLFMVFAVSFFGAFEIMLPNKWVSKADSRVDKGGIAASFFLGLTTVLVSFSCTGPIVGALLVEAATGDVLRPTIGMFGFGLAFAIPFTLLALFPSAVNKLPKSGGWLNAIKVVLGFIMVGFSLKFISTIDSVYNLNIISRDLFISIWIALAVLLGLYLLGKIKLPHDSEAKQIGVFRFFLAIIAFSFAVYLVPGLFGAPLTGLSGMMPSREKSKFNIESVIRSSLQSQPGTLSPATTGVTLSETCSEPKYGDFLYLPHGLQGYFEIEQGLACAKEQGKPVFLDFTGHACSNCREMEAKVWADPEVLRRLRENFVVVGLYVDDRTRLPEEEWITSEEDGRVKRTIGQINQDISISRFRTNALPLYVLADHDGNPLNTPRQHDLDVKAFIEWLDEGYRRFMEMQEEDSDSVEEPGL